MSTYYAPITRRPIRKPTRRVLKCGVTRAVCRNNREQPLTKLSVINKWSRREITTTWSITFQSVWSPLVVPAWHFSSKPQYRFFLFFGPKSYFLFWLPCLAPLKPGPLTQHALHLRRERRLPEEPDARWRWAELLGEVFSGNLRRGDLKSRFCAETSY